MEADDKPMVGQNVTDRDVPLMVAEVVVQKIITVGNEFGSKSNLDICILQNPVVPRSHEAGLDGVAHQTSPYTTVAPSATSPVTLVSMVGITRSAHSGSSSAPIPVITKISW